MKSTGNKWSLAAVVVGVVALLNPAVVARADSRPEPHLHVKGRVTTPDGRAAAGATIYRGDGWGQQLRSALNGVTSNCIDRVHLSVKADATYELVYLFENTAACVTAMNNATVDKSKILWTLPSPAPAGGAEFRWNFKTNSER